MKRTIITILIALGAIAGAALALRNNKTQMQAQVELARTVNSTIPVQVATVKEERLGGAFSATGNFTPLRELTIVTEASGKVVRLLADEGQYVTKGQLLGRIEFATLEADLKSAEANLQKLSTDKERYERLVKSGGVTQGQLDEINLAWVNAETRVINARKKLDDSFIRAPFSGYINKRYVEEGAYVTPGKQIFDIVDTSKLKMIVNVTERQVLQISEASKIKVQADVYPGVTYEARVKFISAKADANLNFPVELEITNVNDKPLRAGMFGRATFELSEGSSSLVMPRAAVAGSLDEGEVYAVNGDSVVKKKVTTGRTFGSLVEVLDVLSAGDQVVINGQINLSDGARISVVN